MKITYNQTYIQNHSALKKNPPSFQGLKLNLDEFFLNKERQVEILKAFEQNSYLMDYFKKNDVRISISEEFQHNTLGMYFNVFMDVKFRKLPKQETVLTKPNSLQRLFGMKPREKKVTINDSWKNINIKDCTYDSDDTRINVVERIISSFSKENTIEQKYQRKLFETQKKIAENLETEQKLKELSDKILAK